MSEPARSTPIVFNLTVNVSPECAAIFVDLARRLADIAGAPAWSATPTPVVPAAATPLLRTPTARAPSPRLDLRAAQSANPAGSWRTPERAAVLRELWPTATPTKEIFARCAALPGAMVPGLPSIGKWAAALGLHRPPDRPNPFRDGPPSDSWRTPERRQLIQELWPAGVPTREIASRLGALPGSPLSPKVNKHIGILAWNMGLARPPGTPNPFRKAVPPSAVEPSETDEIPTQGDKPSLSVDEMRPEPGATPTAADAPIAAVKSAPAPPVPPPVVSAPPTWTPDRTALVRRDYPLVRVRTADLLAQVNALPGAAMSEVWLHNYAITALKLSRRPDAPRQPLPPSPAPAARRAVAREAIEAWCASRGWRFDKFDIDAINRRCASVGHPGFVVLEPSRRGAAV